MVWQKKTNFKSIGKNFKIDTFLILRDICKKSFFLEFITNLLKNKKRSNLEIITNRFEIKCTAIKFLQILIPTKNEFFMSF
jgi:hypothetical protein